MALDGEVILGVKIDTSAIKQDLASIKADLKNALSSNGDSSGVTQLTSSIGKLSQDVVTLTKSIGTMYDKLNQTPTGTTTVANQMQQVQTSVTSATSAMGQLSTVSATTAKSVQSISPDKIKLLEADLKVAETKFDSLSNRADILRASLKQLDAGDSLIVDAETGISNIRQITEALDYYKQKYEDVMRVINKSKTSASMDTIYEADSLSATVNRLEQAKEAILKYNETLAQLEKQSIKVETAQNKLAQAKSANLSQPSKEANKYANALRNIGNSSKKASSQLAKMSGVTDGLSKAFKKGLGVFKKFALAMLGVRGLYMLFRKLRSAIVESFQNLAQYSDEVTKNLSDIKSASTQFKNSMSTMLQPLLTAVTPILIQIIHLATQATTAIAKLMAALSGQGYYYEAIEVQEDYAKSLDKTAKSAGKAASNLLAIDKLNVITSPGGSGDGDATKDMFKKVEFDTNPLDKFKDKFKNIMDKCKEYWSLFKDGFKDGFKDNDIQPILDNLEKIKDNLIAIYSAPEVKSAMDNLFSDSAFASGQIVGAGASIGVSVGKNITGGIAQWLDEDQDDIKGRLIDLTDTEDKLITTSGEVASAMAEIFEPIGEENGVEVTANAMGILYTILSDTVILTEKLRLSLTTLFSTPITEQSGGIAEFFNNALGWIATITGGIKEFISTTGARFSAMWTEHIQPIFDKLGGLISDIIGKVTEALNGRYKEDFDRIAELFASLANDSGITDFITNLIDALGDVGDLIASIIELLAPFIADTVMWLIDMALPVILNFVENLLTWLPTFLSIFVNIGNIVTSFISATASMFTMLFDLLLGKFDEAGAKASEWILSSINIVSSALNTLISFVETVLEAIASAVRFVAGIIIDTVANIFSHIGDLASFIPSGIAETFGVDLDLSFMKNWAETLKSFKSTMNEKFNVPRIQIPQLAQGAVIPPNKEFMAILGDQTSGNNIETPEALLRKIVREESGMGSITIPLTIDGREIARAVVDQDKISRNTRGYGLLGGV